MFNELVEFVEVEQAWSEIAWGDKEARKLYNAPFWACGWFRVRTWRSAPAGVAHLNWAMTLTLGTHSGMDESDPDFNKPSHQAIAAKEIHGLYKWYKEVRPARPDPYEISGWSEICSRHRGDDIFMFGEPKTQEEKDERRAAFDKLSQIEIEYESEDEAMLIRLIKVRGNLWT